MAPCGDDDRRRARSLDALVLGPHLLHPLTLPQAMEVGIVLEHPAHFLSSGLDASSAPIGYEAKAELSF
jgi:hypothetical protein